MTIDLSIIIVSYKVKNFVIQCLKSIFSNAKSIKLEVILVDNASFDGTVEQIRREFPLVNVINNQQNLGFPRANNQALEISSGRIILLLNPDTIVQPGALFELCCFLGNHRKGAIVGLNVRNTDGSRQHSTNDIPSVRDLIFSSLNLHFLFPKKHCPIIESSQVIRVGYVSGAALSFSRAVFEQIGGFDESLFWMEDIDFCYRAYHAGLPVYFLPSAAVMHFGGESTKSNIRRVLFHQHVSKIKFFEKHYSWAAVNALKAIFFAELCGKILVRSLQWLVPSLRIESRNRISGYVTALDFIIRRRKPVWV